MEGPSATSNLELSSLRPQEKSSSSTSCGALALDEGRLLDDRGEFALLDLALDLPLVFGDRLSLHVRVLGAGALLSCLTGAAGGAM